MIDFPFPLVPLLILSPQVWKRFSFEPFQCVASVVAHSESIIALTLTGGNRLVTACVDGKMKQWNADTWDRHLTMASQTRFVYVLSSCYTYILSGGSDGLLKVWDRVSGMPIGAFIAHIGCYTAGVAVMDGTVLSVGSDDRKLKVHDITPWLIAGIDAVDMFQVWRVLKGPATSGARAVTTSALLCASHTFLCGEQYGWPCIRCILDTRFTVCVCGIDL